MPELITALREVRNLLKKRGVVLGHLLSKYNVHSFIPNSLVLVTKQAVDSFYLRDDVSRALPRKGDLVTIHSTSGKVQIAMRHLLMSLKEDHHLHLPRPR
jgi:hypothetical protein